MAKVHRHSAAFYSLRLTLVLVCILRVAKAPPLNDALKCEIPEFESAYFAGYPKPAWVKVNERLIFRCKEKHYDRPTYSTCTGGNLWETPFPPCQLVRCPDPEVIPHGKASTVKDPGVGDNMKIDCDEGYWFTGSHTRICQRTGKWDGNEGKCKRIECEAFDFQNGTLNELPPYYSNTFLKVTCNKGFVSTNPTGIKCQRDRTWSGSIGECKEISKIHCTFIPTDYEKTSGSKFTPYGSSIAIDCEEGFAYNGTTYRTCTANSTWSGTDGRCNRIFCEKPSFKIPKGKFDACDPCPYGTQLQVTCDEGYFPKNNITPVCKNDGTAGKWFNVNEFCKGIGCGSIPEIENGKIKGIKNGSFMDKRPVQCDQGYEYVGPGTITCQHDGQWSFPGVCSKGMYVAMPIAVTLGVILLMIIIITVGIVFRMKRNDGGKRLKVSIRKAGHVVENVLDPKINLDKDFVPLKLITSRNEATQKMMTENVAMDKYLSYLERYEHEEVSSDDLIDGMEGGGLMIVCGRAGVGKTTLVQKLARRWAQKDWAQNYGAVFVYNMRYISPKDHRPVTLAEFLESYMLYKPRKFYPDISKGITVQGEGWIIFMDAIDEFPNLMTRLEKCEDLYSLPGDTRLPAHDWCIRLLRRTSILQKVVLVVTSRHIKGLDKLEPKKSVEVMGLTPHSIREMIDLHIKKKSQADHFKGVYQINPIILSVSSITFFCVMLCKSYNENQNLEELTSGMTTYTRITMFLIQMYIKRNAYEKEDNEETPLNHSEMMKILPLAKLAYNGLVANQKDPNHAQLAFDEDDLTTAGVSDKDLSMAQEHGLLVRSELQLPGKEENKVLITEFVHLSMQELLAMVYLINDPNEYCTAVDIFNIMWSKKRFYMAQLYLFGLSFDKKLSGVEPLVPNRQNPYAEKLKQELRQALVESAGRDREDRHQVLRAMQAAYETHDPEVANKVANALFLDGKIRLQDMPLTAVDLLGIISMVESHKQISEIWLEYISTDENFLKILSTFLFKNNTLTTISLKGIVQTKTTFHSLMDAVSENTSIQRLYLEYAEIDDEMMGELGDVLKNNKFLEEISIAHNRITDVGISKVARGLHSNESLKNLILDTDRMDHMYIRELSYLTTGNNNVEIVLHGPPLPSELAKYVQDSKSLQNRITHKTQ